MQGHSRDRKSSKVSMPRQKALIGRKMNDEYHKFPATTLKILQTPFISRSLLFPVWYSANIPEFYSNNLDPAKSSAKFSQKHQWKTPTTESYLYRTIEGFAGLHGTECEKSSKQRFCGVNFSGTKVWMHVFSQPLCEIRRISGRRIDLAERQPNRGVSRAAVGCMDPFSRSQMRERR